MDILAKSETRICKLHPVVAEKARQLVLKAASEGINILIVQGLRTMEEQATLYAQGRTTKGQIVTNAKAGTSYHNYGLAIDYSLFNTDCTDVVWTVNDRWRRVAQIGKSLGFDWGGDWIDFKDYPHLEMTFGLSIRDLLNGKRPPTSEPKPPVPLVTEVKEELNQEDEDIMKLTQNQWTMLGNAIDGWFKKGWITDYTWATKAYAGELTLSEYAWLTGIVFTRQNGIQV